MSKIKVTTISDPDNDNTAISIDSSGNATFSQNVTFSGSTTGISVSGGANVESISTNKTLTFSDNRFQLFDPTASGLNVTLPSASSLEEGESFTIVNKSSQYGFIIKNGSGDPLTFLTAGYSVKFLLADNSTTSGDWEAIINSLGGSLAITSLQSISTSQGNHNPSLVRLSADNYLTYLVANDQKVEVNEIIYSNNQFTTSSVNSSSISGVSRYLAVGEPHAYVGSSGTNHVWVEQTWIGYDTADMIYHAIGYDTSSNTLIASQQYDQNTHPDRAYYNATCASDSSGGWVAFGSGSNTNNGYQTTGIMATAGSTDLAATTITVTRAAKSWVTRDGTSTSDGGYHIDCCQLDTNKGLVCNSQYQNDELHIAVWTRSGTSISLGTIVQVTSETLSGAGYQGQMAKVVKGSDANTAYVFWVNSNNVLKGAKLTISGTSVTVGTTYTLAPFSLNANYTVKYLNGTLWVLANNSNDLNKLYAIKLIDSSGVLSYTTPSKISEAAPIYSNKNCADIVYEPNDDSYIIVYSSTFGGTIMKSVAGGL